jgi:hypothetical protein
MNHIILLFLLLLKLQLFHSMGQLILGSWLQNLIWHISHAATAHFPGKLSLYWDACDNQKQLCHKVVHNSSQEGFAAG